MPAKISVCLLVFLILICIEVTAAPDMIWVIMDQTDLDDISKAETENIDYLQEKGAFGLVNVRTVDYLRPESTYLSIGAARRCQGNYRVHTGENYNGMVVNNDIEFLQELNKNTTYNAQPGLIGKTLRLNNRKIAVLGNADNKNDCKRTVVSMVMDEKGVVPLGDVSKDLLKKSDFPWGWETDWHKMKKQYSKYKELADVIVIETGDITRVEDLSSQLNPQQINAHKKQALEKIDDFIGFLLTEINLKQTELALIIPTPSTESRKRGSRLSWTLFAGGKYHQGWLTSSSTRRKGIITMSDLAPAMLAAAGIRHGSLIDKTPEVIADNVTWEDLVNLNQKITIISNLRSPFIKGFIILQLLVILLALINMFWENSIISVINKIIFEYLLLTLLLIPINYLIISMFLFASALSYVLLLAVLSILEIVVIMRYINNRLLRIVIIIIPLIIIIIGDLIGNIGLMADSLLGYSSIIGARYYGIGNEYMGLFIGALLIGISGFLELFKKSTLFSLYLKLSLITILFSIYIIGANNLGVNFGGMITMIGTGFIALYYLTRQFFGIRFYVILFALCILLLIGIVYLDYIEILAPRSHIGEFIKKLITGNFSYVKQIITRKINMNIKLLKWTIWTRALLAFLVYFIILFIHPVGKIKQILSRYQLLSAGFYGGISGGFLTMFVNDSGVVAAATILFFPMLTLLYLIQEREM